MALFKSNNSFDLIARDIRWVQALRKNTKKESVYLEQLNTLQQWQTQRMEQCYSELMASSRYRPLLDFFQACHQANAFDAMFRQKNLVKLFADDLNKTVHSRLVYGAIRLAKIPAVKAGFGDLYQLIERGFTALSMIDNPEALIDQIIKHEKQIVENIRDDTANPFTSLEIADLRC